MASGTLYKLKLMPVTNYINALLAIPDKVELNLQSEKTSDLQRPMHEKVFSL